MNPIADKPRAGAPAASMVQPAARSRYKLLDECREIVVLRLAEVVHEALDKMTDHLADEAMRSGSIEQRQALLEALSVVREQRTEIESRFRRSFNDVFERRMFKTRAPEAASNSAVSIQELSLVSDDEIDERLEVDRLVHRARSRLDPDEVLGIRARLGALIEREWFEENAHPASPHAVFEALKLALAELTPRHDVKSALLDAFEPHVSANLNTIYVRVNERLKANQILPRIRAVPQVSPSAGASAPNSAAASGAAADASSAAPGVGGESGALGGLSSAGAMPAWGGLPGSGSQALPVGATLGAMLQHLTQGQPSARLSAARMLSDPEMFGMADLPLPAVGGSLIESLSALQAGSVQGAQQVPADASAPLVPAASLFELLSKPVREQGSPLDQITVEVVSIVFDFIHGDRRLPDPIKHQLMRMQVVAVKAALIDRSFFARRQHPMRRLMDRISEIGADPDSEVSPGSPLLAGLSHVVDGILAEFEHDLAVFERALEKIEHLVQAQTAQCAQWLSSQTLQAEQQERVALARDAAYGQIAMRIDATAPPFIREFLSRRWVDVLAASHVDPDPGSSAWDDALRVVEELLWSVAPKAPGEVVQLAQLLPRLIAALMRGVKQIDFPEDERQAFFDELLRAHTQAIAAAKSSTPGSRRATSDASSPNGDSNASDPVRQVAPRMLEDADASMLEPLVRGDRIELIDDDGQVQRYKLAWISPARKLFILSRHPRQARSMDSGELAALFGRGRARIAAPEASVLERAIHAVVSDVSNAAPS